VNRIHAEVITARLNLMAVHYHLLREHGGDIVDRCHSKITGYKTISVKFKVFVKRCLELTIEQANKYVRITWVKIW